MLTWVLNESVGRVKYDKQEKFGKYENNIVVTIEMKLSVKKMHIKRFQFSIDDVLKTSDAHQS